MPDTWHPPEQRFLALAPQLDNRYGSRGTPSCIDFPLYNGIPDDMLLINDTWDLHSDHLALIITMNTEGINSISEPGHLSKKTNIKKFQQKLNESIHLNMELKTGEDIDAAVDLLTMKVQNAADQSDIINTHHPGDKASWQETSKRLKETIRLQRTCFFEKRLEALDYTVDSGYEIVKAAADENSPH